MRPGTVVGSLVFQHTGEFQQIWINGRPGQVCVLESSTDLRNWVPLERGGSQTGTMVYQDPDHDSAMRFYRVRIEAEGIR